MFKSSDLLGIEKVTIGFPKFLVVTINIFWEAIIKQVLWP